MTKFDPHRLQLGIYPTPLQQLRTLSRELGFNLWVKRDDMCGLMLGGNKVRKLEYLLAQAIDMGSDVVLTTGGAQSNHAMLTAACCRQLGLHPVLVLMGEPRQDSGNLLLDRLLDAEVIFTATGEQEINAELEYRAAGWRAAGHRPYIIPMGGSNPLGAYGYFTAMQEMAEQCREQGVYPTHLVCANGSGGTYAGTMLGASVYLPQTQVIGINVGAVSDAAGNSLQLLNAAAEMYGLQRRFNRDDVDCRDYFGAGYAIPSPQGMAAISRLACNEALLLDPVYTGKAMAGLLDLAQQGCFPPGADVVFLHTGGAAGLFAELAAVQ